MMAAKKEEDWKRKIEDRLDSIERRMYGREAGAAHHFSLTLSERRHNRNFQWDIESRVAYLTNRYADHIREHHTEAPKWWKFWR